MSGAFLRTKIVKVDAQNPDPELLKEGANLIARGGLVAFPTETVYGLAANLDDPQAIQELYFVKQRPFGKQVTVHIADKKGVQSQDVVVTPLAEALMDRFWPGPLTLVLPKADGSSVGFRVPDHAVARVLIDLANVPVVAPSANLSDEPPPKDAQEVLDGLADKIDMVIDAGPTPGGVSSTVLSLVGEKPEILREGAELEAIQKFLEDYA